MENYKVVACPQIAILFWDVKHLGTSGHIGINIAIEFEYIPEWKRQFGANVVIHK